MLRTLVPSLVVLAPLALPASAAQETAAQGPSVEGLVPSDAFLLLRIESIDALEGAAKRLTSWFAPEEEADMDLVAELAGEVGADGSDAALQRVDRTRPLAMALSLDETTQEPIPSFLVPVDDPAAFGEELVLADPSLRVVPSAGYAVVTGLPGYTSGGAGARLASDMGPGLVVLEIDVARLIEAYRPMIEDVLEMFGMMAEMQAPEAMPPGAESLDVGALVDSWTDGAFALLDSADRLEVSFALRGDQVRVVGDLRVKPDSPMASLELGDQAADLPALARRLVPGEPIAMVASLDVAAMMQAFEPWMELSIAAYPPEMRDAMAAWMTGYADTYHLLGGGFAGGGGFGPDGLRFSAFYASPEPRELLEAYGAATEALQGTEGLSVEGLERTEIAGAPAMTFRMRMDADALLASMRQMSGEDVDPSEVEAMRAAMETILGPDGWRYVYAALPDGMVMAFGGGESYADTVVRRLVGAPGEVPAPLAWPIERIGGRSPSFALSFDMGVLMSQMMPMIEDMMRAAGETAPPVSELPSAPVALFGAIGEGAWSLGMSADGPRLGRLVRALEEE